MSRRRNKRQKTLCERFWAKVHFNPNGCWEWTGASFRGYGQITMEFKRQYAYRASLWMIGIETPKGMHVDHLCRNPPCVNPAHLEVVTPRTNTLRGMAGIARTLARAKVNHCKYGHEYTDENTTIAPDGARTCVICKNEAYHRWYYSKGAESIRLKRGTKTRRHPSSCPSETAPVGPPACE